ncbi:phosphoglucosamine mutase [Chamaesiphon polymorphus]|uniref:Phosphoglucosamine mutase n=1 Tax=Chamaesiphon polymorphus CCALA 037 TaxID=2107692 RepID=A0A2T1GEK6_9CYAN|nr:phosphoglucosamine mutase [Chamaesiphon polymorphus]PSB55918.1 phosphoglucosamine mutase [Chamaesiphon polymorphus CCALA 037]
MITSSPIEHLNLPNSPLFGTDGIRGRVGDVLTANLALQVGYWAGIVLRQAADDVGPIVIGQDSRNSSDMLASALAAGLTSAGIEVWNLGLCPTPGVAHLTATSDAIGGVMISASHNPPEDNGIKFFGSDGTKLAKDLQAAIEAGIRGQSGSHVEPERWGQLYFTPELITQYVEAMKDSLLPDTSLAGMKIVLDLAAGAAVDVAPKIFTQLGAELICLHEEADGDRINVNCGSTHLGSLQAAVALHQADLGFAFDGDADRVLAVDNRGRKVDGDYILYFWGQHLSQLGLLPNDAIVTTVMANLGFERAWQALGGTVVRTAVGDQYVQAEMASSGAMLGGEQSGHILSPQHSVSGDGILTALHVTAIVQQSGKSLAELVDSSFQTYPQILHNVRVDDREARLNWAKCQPLQDAIAEAEAEMGNTGRVLVRASGTEPLIRVMVEAESMQKTEYWTKYLVAIVEQHF